MHRLCPKMTVQRCTISWNFCGRCPCTSLYRQETFFSTRALYVTQMTHFINEELMTCVVGSKRGRASGPAAAEQPQSAHGRRAIRVSGTAISLYLSFRDNHSPYRQNMISKTVYSSSKPWIAYVLRRNLGTPSQYLACDRHRKASLSRISSIAMWPSRTISTN